ncbi:citrate synthase family protein [soil metagenome]
MNQAGAQVETDSDSPDRQFNQVAYVTREEALKLLGVKLQSFYTYVSRGMIRTLEQPGKKRKLYLRDDVARLGAKSQAKTSSGAKAANAMRFGDPVIQTFICAITPRGPVYRNRLATDLASSGISFESVSELLWSGTLRTPEIPWSAEPLPERFGDWLRLADSIDTATPPLGILQLLVSALRCSDTAELSSSFENTGALSRRLVQVFAGSSGYLGESRRFEPFQDRELVAACIARGLGHGDEHQTIDAINSALILCAEHELTPPTFATRVCASTGADLYACVGTGIFAQSGPLQGGGTDGAEDFLEEVLEPSGKFRLARSGWSSKFEFPGFNHPLYSRDPRAEHLIALARNIDSPGKDSEKVLRLIDDIERDINFYPNITAALVVLSRALGLPKRSANLLFSVGRVSGWIAHVLEQRVAGYMLRPRAKFAVPSHLTKNAI